MFKDGDLVKVKVGKEEMVGNVVNGQDRRRFINGTVHSGKVLVALQFESGVKGRKYVMLDEKKVKPLKLGVAS